VFVSGFAGKMKPIGFALSGRAVRSSVKTKTTLWKVTRRKIESRKSERTEGERGELVRKSLKYFQFEISFMFFSQIY